MLLGLIQSINLHSFQASSACFFSIQFALHHVRVHAVEHFQVERVSVISARDFTLLFAR